MASTVRASGPQGATFVELFFDLVFVFAVTQVTHGLAEHLDATGVLRGLLVFWLVWWAWTQFTWTLNAADTEHAGIELLTMAGLVAAFLMALAVPEAFGATGAWFAGAYTATRLIGIGGQFWVSIGDADARRTLRTWATLSLAVSPSSSSARCCRKDPERRRSRSRSPSTWCRRGAPVTANGACTPGTSRSVTACSSSLRSVSR